MKKVLFINGSPRKNGHTVEALRLVEDRLKADGIETDWVNIGSKPVRGCMVMSYITNHTISMSEFLTRIPWYKYQFCLKSLF